MTLSEFNIQSKETAQSQLQTCCGSQRWQEKMMARFPFADEETLMETATEAWYACNEQDWKEAFTHHPKIGDTKSLAERFASTAALAGNEQALVNEASLAVIEELALANAEYEKKFGFIFIVCATGRSAPEMLGLLKDRLQNTKDEEMNIAMGEQAKITGLRLKKILSTADWSKIKISQLTTHVLDTSIGKPGRNITVRLKKNDNGTWKIFAQGITNDDGRIADLLPSGKLLPPGNYKLVFETGAYYHTQKIKSFYPETEIQFTITDGAHYHVPLLLNPFGYSTYRGS
jgi:5-hydroxyisourate hydrolase/2-oxo-4-hydroxy-4-carboxy-5-ureidoimidazoline decarboxylase